MNRLPLLGASAFVLGATTMARGPVTTGTSATDALVSQLAGEGLSVRPDSVSYLDDGAVREALFLAREGRAPLDVYSASVRVAGATVLDVWNVSNLTRTAGAEESNLIRHGRHAAFTSTVRERIDAITVLDLQGEPEADTASWSRRERLQESVTRWLETGRARGFGRKRFAVEPSARTAELGTDGEAFVATLDGERVVIDPSTGPVATATRTFTEATTEKSRPAGITWVVDTVRSLSFVGPEPIAWLENRVYGIRDRWLRLRYAIVAPDDDTATEGPSVAEREALRARIRELGAVGFPPERIEPIVRTEESSSDGDWLPIVDDAFVGSYPNAAPAFATTSLRVDPARPFARAHLVAWDPRQVQLRAVSGTREPESASGAFGTGVVPRVPERLPRLVAAFNGGFQAMHGEFGMMADRTVYLPPKPYAATVGVTSTGTVVLGSWQGLPEGARFYTERAAIAQIPPDLVDLRQNLTTVIEGDRINPWERWYWGAANVNATEQTFVDRSGLCITRDGFVVYFWGNSMGAEQLGAAMRAARCERGMHLDMNAKHTQFEYYNVVPESRPLPELGRRLAEHEFESAYPGVPGIRVRGRLAVPQMDPQEFPRYVKTEARDFFYLELRPTLPGPALADGTTFDARALPQPGYPWAFARARVLGSQVVRVDLSRAVPAPLGEGGATLAVLPSAGGALALYATAASVGRTFAVGPEVPTGATEILRGAACSAAGDDVTVAAVAVDPDGFLLYAEGPDACAALERAGGGQALSLASPARFEDGGTVMDVHGNVADRVDGVALLARQAPYTAVLNPEVEPRGYRHWGRIQDSRVRYIPPEGPRRFVQGQ